MGKMDFFSGRYGLTLMLKFTENFIQKNQIKIFKTHQKHTPWVFKNYSNKRKKINI